MTEIATKIDTLAGELKSKSARELSLAAWSHWLNLGAMVLTLAATGVAVTYGMLPGHTSQVTALLALIPGAIALVATSLKLEMRCNWHYKRHYALAALIRELEIELSDPPTREELVSISKSITKLEIDMEALWEKDLSLNWNHFQSK